MREGLSRRAELLFDAHRDSPGWVYFIGCQFPPPDGSVKIGMTMEPTPYRRLHALQTASPFDLEVLATVRGGKNLEAALHSLLHTHRRKREWFQFCPDVREVVSLAKSKEPEHRERFIETLRAATNSIGTLARPYVPAIEQRPAPLVEEPLPDPDGWIPLQSLAARMDLKPKELIGDGLTVSPNGNVAPEEWMAYLQKGTMRDDLNWGKIFRENQRKERQGEVV